MYVACIPFLFHLFCCFCWILFQDVFSLYELELKWLVMFNLIICVMRNYLLFLLLFLVRITAFSQEIITYQSFEMAGDSWTYTISPEAFNEGGDVWGIVDASFHSFSSLPSNGLNFFGVQDLNCDAGTSDWGTIQFSDVDLSLYSSVSLRFDLEVNGYDNNDDIKLILYFNQFPAIEKFLIEGYSNLDLDSSFVFFVPDSVHTFSLSLMVKQNGTDYAGFDQFVLQGNKTGEDLFPPEINWSLEQSVATVDVDEAIFLVFNESVFGKNNSPLSEQDFYSLIQFRNENTNEDVPFELSYFPDELKLKISSSQHFDYGASYRICLDTIYDASGNDSHSVLNFSTKKLRLEPEEHFAMFQCDAFNFEKILISWQKDTSEATPADGALVVLSELEIPSPDDGIELTEVYNVDAGIVAIYLDSSITSYAFDRLKPQTSYFISIFPFNNKGEFVDYKTDGHIPSLEIETASKAELYITEVAGKGFDQSYQQEYIEVYSKDENMSLNPFHIEYFESGMEKRIDLQGMVYADSVIVIAARSGDLIDGVQPFYGGSSFSLNNPGYVILKDSLGSVIHQAGSETDKFQKDKNYVLYGLDRDARLTKNWLNLETENGSPGRKNISFLNDIEWISLSYGDSTVFAHRVSKDTVEVKIPFFFDLKALDMEMKVSFQAEIVTEIEHLRDFSSPVYIEIKAENGNLKKWTILVKQELSPEKFFSDFYFIVSGRMYKGLILEDSSRIKVELPYGMEDFALTPFFEFTGNSVYVNELMQYSGEVTHDFSAPVYYVIFAEDQTFRSYEVIVKNAAPSDNAWLKKLSVNNQVIDEFDRQKLLYEIELPYQSAVVPVLTAVPEDSTASILVQQAQSLQGSESERTASIHVLAQNKVDELEYKVIFSVALNNDCSFELNCFDLDKEKQIIRKIPYKLPVDLFLECLVPAEGAESRILEKDGISEASFLTDSCILEIVAENQTDMVKYLLMTKGRPEVFISEYIHLNSGSFAVEMVNPTLHSIDLSDYKLSCYAPQGKKNQRVYSFSGELKSGHVFVVCNPTADILIRDVADTIVELFELSGSESVALYKNDTLIDLIGDISSDNSNAFHVAGIPSASMNHVLVRKKETLNGNTNWVESCGTTHDDSEWLVFDAGHFFEIGRFNMAYRTDVYEFSLGDHFPMADLIRDSSKIKVFLPDTLSNFLYAPKFRIAQHAKVFVGDSPQISEITLNDFSNDIDYKVVAENGDEQIWTICPVLTYVPFWENKILSFQFENQIGETIIDEDRREVRIQMEEDADLSHLCPVIQISPKADISPSPSECHDFSEPVIYTIRAENGNEVEWQVIVELEQVKEVSIAKIHEEEGDGLHVEEGEKLWIKAQVVFVTDSGFHVQDKAEEWSGIFVRSEQQLQLNKTYRIKAYVGKTYDRKELVNVHTIESMEDEHLSIDAFQVNAYEALREKHRSMLLCIEKIECTELQNDFALFEDDYGQINCYYFEGMQVPKLQNWYKLTGVNVSGSGLFPRMQEDISLISSTVGIERHVLTLYPNPVKDFLNIDLQSEEPVIVKLIALNGSLVKQFTIAPGTQTMDLSFLNTGVYTVLFSFQNKTVVKKIAKE